MTLVVVLGGTRSGKSAVAEHLAVELAAPTSQPVTYLATGTATDADMVARIAAHRARRPAGWATLEASGPALPDVLRELEGLVLLDSIGTWVAAHRDFAVGTGALVAALVARPGTTVVVAEEVGLSVHPPTPLGRQFVDAVGAVNQAVTAVADRALLVVAGRTVELPPPGLPPARLSPAREPLPGPPPAQVPPPRSDRAGSSRAELPPAGPAPASS